jgi:penicillin amidase
MSASRDRTPDGRPVSGIALRGAAPWLARISRRRLSQIAGRLRLNGLQDAVEVIRDRWGVPHIYARNTADLFYAQGFVHAQDRLWQMDFQRRLASGRLAEVLGGRALPVDRWLRILGFRRVAEVEADLTPPEVRIELEAYAAGVNAWIACGRFPIEFTLLRYRPEPWLPADSLVWAKMISWSLSFNWESELLRAQLIARLGAERAAELEPAYPARCPLIVPAGANYAGIGEAAQRLAEEARPFTGPAAGEGVGSNNWAVSGARSMTGMPLLAGDMHLPMGIPAIWYENHLVELTGAEDALDVTGISLPGAPGVASGHNGHVAWSFTAAFADVQDTYLEHLRRRSETGGVEYEFCGQWLPAEVIREEIRVRGGKPVSEEVVVTRHGPIIDALAGDLRSGVGLPRGEGGLALSWTAFEPETMLAAVRQMNRAKTCASFREGLQHWTSPAVNIVYADTRGDIAYHLIGRVPMRRGGDGRVPAPGWTGEYEWQGAIPFDELPQRLNPPEGYLVTANNRVAAEDYPHFISHEYATGNRAQRITELIVERDRLDLAAMQTMQFDRVSPQARIVARALGGLTTQDPELAAVAASMRAWDGDLTPDSREAAICACFAVQMARLILRDRLGDLAERYMGRGPTPVVADGSLFVHRAQEWLEDQLARPDSPWYDLGDGETRDAVMARALRAALSELEQRLGPVGWAWGRLHTLTFLHYLGRVEPFASLFNRGPFPIGGDGNTVWATGSRLHGPQPAYTIGPPFRFVADLGDLRHARAILAPGQSGQPGSPFYEDQVGAWFAGEYHPMLYDRGDIEREAFARLTLEPAA